MPKKKIKFLKVAVGIQSATFMAKQHTPYNKNLYFIVIAVCMECAVFCFRFRIYEVAAQFAASYPSYAWSL